MNFAAVVCEVDKHLAPDATVTSDAGNFGSFVHRYIGFRQGQVFLSVGGRRDGLGHADGGRGGAAPAGHAGGGVRRRRRRADDGQRDRHRAASTASTRS